MLTVVSEVSLKRAIDAERGNVQSFLERLLTEVVGENYRYFLAEHLALRDHYEAPHASCRPPLLANERQVSGLFAIGLSRVCPISSPEHPISRARRALESDDSGPPSKSGRVDFLAYYGRRHIAIELKRCPISRVGEPQTKAGLSSQWNVVSAQAKEALVHMRAQSSDYDHPVSIGLLVVRVSRKVTSRRDAEHVRETESAELPQVAASVAKLTKADFCAYYTAPAEMQVHQVGETEGSEHRVYPGLVFAAVVHGSTKQASRADA